MKNFVSLLLCFTLVACSNTKVHLYTRYLSENEIEKISTILAHNNFKVVSNTLAFPDKTHQSTLLYSPFIQNVQSLDILSNALSTVGWPISSVQSLVMGNHWYKNDSIALLLVPEGLKTNDRIAVQDLINVYQSTNCHTSVSIRLNKDHSHQLFFEKNMDIRTDHLTGNWQVRSYPYIELTSFNERWRFYFEIEQKLLTDNVSAIALIELKPIDTYHYFPNCSFEYGIRVS